MGTNGKGKFQDGHGREPEELNINAAEAREALTATLERTKVEMQSLLSEFKAANQGETDLIARADIALAKAMKKIDQLKSIEAVLARKDILSETLGGLQPRTPDAPEAPVTPESEPAAPATETESNYPEPAVPAPIPDLAEAESVDANKIVLVADFEANVTSAQSLDDLKEYLHNLANFEMVIDYGDKKYLFKELFQKLEDWQARGPEPDMPAALKAKLIEFGSFNDILSGMDFESAISGMQSLADLKAYLQGLSDERKVLDFGEEKYEADVLFRRLVAFDRNGIKEPAMPTVLRTKLEELGFFGETPTTTSPVDPETTPATPSVEPEVKSGNVTEEADFEVLPNDDNTERKADSEDNHEQEPQNLEEARLAWLKSLRKRGNLFKRDKLGSSNAVDVYKNFLQAKLVSNLESKQQELLAGMNPDTLDEAKIREIVEALASSHIALLQEEENQIDLLSSGLEQSSMQKFKALWRKYAKSRLVLGAGLFVGGAALTAATGGVGGLLAGILTARGMLSSAGTFLGAESFIDTRSKWGGQKGIIDEMKNLGYTFGGFNKFGIKIKASEASVISQEDVDYWAGKDGKPGRLEEKYSTDQLGQELARLRILSLDKGASIKDAARFGGEQEQFVKIIEAVYYKKLKEDLKQKLSSAGPLVAQSEIIQSTVQNNIEAEQNLLISEQDKSRAKAMARYGLSAALGLTVGLVAGSRVFGALDHKDAAEAGKSVQGVVYNPEEHKFNPSLNNSDGWHPPMSPETVPSHQDFNMTESATSASTEAATQATAEHASAVVDTHSVTPTGTNSLENVINTDKGMQGHDSIWRSTKDIVKSDPQRFGYTGTPGDADAIAKFTDMKTAELVNQLEQDQGGHLKDLVHNGDKVIVSFEGDKATLSFNPSSGIDAGHLSEIQQSASSAVESGSVEAPNSTGAQAILDNAKAQAEWAKNDYSKFVNGAGEYSSEVYKTALSIQDTGAVNDVVNKVFESSAEVQQQFLHDIDPSHFTGANGKAEIFLKTIAESQKIKLADINSLEELQKHVAAFDRLVADKSLPTNVWTPKLFSDGQGNEIYALVKAKGGLFSFLGEKQYLVDTTVGKPFSVSETGLRNMLENHNVNIDASQNVLTENPPVEPKAEVIEPTAETKIIHEGGIDFASTYSATERASILEYLRGHNMELDDLKNQFAQLARNSSYNQNPNWIKFSDMFKQSLQEHISEHSKIVADLANPNAHLTLETTGNMPLEEAANMRADAEIKGLLINSGVRNQAELAQELLDKEFPVAPELPDEAQFVFKRLSELKEGAVFNDATGDNVFTKINGKIWRYDPVGDPSIEVRDVKDLENLYK